MLKRQDLEKTGLFFQKMTLVAIALLLLTSACQPVPTQLSSATPTRSNTATIEPPSPSETPTLTATPLPTASITPTKTEDCLSMGGKLQTKSLASEILGNDLDFYVYLPPCYQFEPQSDYPVIYLLHGLTFTNDQWLRLGLVSTLDGLIASGEISPAIVVLPREKTFTPSQTSKFPDALVLELLPWIDQNYRTVIDAAYRGIGGISRGAAWAVRIGFSYSNLFSRIGAHSLPVFKEDLSKVEIWAAQTTPQNLPIALIDIGRNDLEVQSAIDFANQLDQYNIPHEFYLFNGEHTEAYWASHLAFYLRWYTQDW